ncbi:hypothetical protein Y1Q_0007108 [Alligator mississippiensis]|uniref:Uncharacterized protein n=1 Tax=Alligator mississippiensis TaxID=8496 RepID=A0A151N6A2_ALLMI|nr:hypothetical protein Y1Q_0007108 [Alligator mississippiensis]
MTDRVPVLEPASVAGRKLLVPIGTVLFTFHVALSLLLWAKGKHALLLQESSLKAQPGANLVKEAEGTAFGWTGSPS